MLLRKMVGRKLPEVQKDGSYVTSEKDTTVVRSDYSKE